MRTVGVEEELLLVDADSGVPVAVAGAVLERQESERPTAAEPGAVEFELQQQQIEVETAPSAVMDDVEHQVRRWRRHVDRLARDSGARLAALATSPVEVTPETTLKPRYLRMIEHFGLTTMEQLTCGCHVHVSVSSDEEGVAVIDRIRSWLPVLLALSANSPYWQGRDSGYASFRSQAWLRFPTAGPTDLFGSPESYQAHVTALVDSGVVLDRAMIYFDARLSHRYPTVEVRVADVCRYSEDTVLLAALTRALVDTAARDWREGRLPAAVPADLLRLASWRAGRSGLAGDLLDPRSARPRAAVDVVADLLSHVERALCDNGDGDRVRDALAQLVRRGPGAVAQRQAWTETHDLGAVVLDAAEATLR